MVSCPVRVPGLGARVGGAWRSCPLQGRGASVARRGTTRLGLVRASPGTRRGWRQAERLTRWHGGVASRWCGAGVAGGGGRGVAGPLAPRLPPGREASPRGRVCALCRRGPCVRCAGAVAQACPSCRGPVSGWSSRQGRASAGETVCTPPARRRRLVQAVRACRAPRADAGGHRECAFGAPAVCLVVAWHGAPSGGWRWLGLACMLEVLPSRGQRGQSGPGRPGVGGAAGPNKGVQATANSVRCAPAVGGA